MENKYNIDNLFIARFSRILPEINEADTSFLNISLYLFYLPRHPLFFFVYSMGYSSVNSLTKHTKYFFIQPILLALHEVQSYTDY